MTPEAAPELEPTLAKLPYHVDELEIRRSAFSLPGRRENQPLPLSLSLDLEPIVRLLSMLGEGGLETLGELGVLVLDR